MNNKFTIILLIFLTTQMFANVNLLQNNDIKEQKITIDIKDKDELTPILNDLKANFNNDNLIENNNKLNDFVKFINNRKDILNLTKNIENDINELSLKSNLNQKNKNILAIKRDEIKIAILNNKVLFINLINNIIIARNDFKSINDLNNIINDYIKNINKNLQNYNETYLSLKEKDNNELTNVESAIVNNYDEYLEDKNLYLYIANFLNNNIKLIYKSNFIKEKINMIYFKAYIDDYINKELDLNDINNAIKHSTDLSIGSIIIAFMSGFLIMLLRYIVYPITIKLLKKDDLTYRNYIIKSIDKPIKSILTILGLHVIISLLHNNQFNLTTFDNIFNSIYTFFILVIIYNLINKGLEVYSETIFNKYPNLRTEMVLFTKRIVITILILSFLSIVLTNFGVNLIALVGGLGVLGIGVGLAFKDIFAHFFGSIMILVDKPFSPGDWIVYKDGEGTVIEIGMRGTRIRTFANAEITVPNYTLSNATILNWSKRKIGRRIKIDLSINYDTKIENFKNLINDIREMLLNHKDIVNEQTIIENDLKKTKDFLVDIENNIGIKKKLMVNYSDLGDTGRIINIYCFTKTIDWQEWRDISQDVLFQIEELIEKNNCHISYKPLKNTLTLDYEQLKEILKNTDKIETK